MVVTLFERFLSLSRLYYPFLNFSPNISGSAAERQVGR